MLEEGRADNRRWFAIDWLGRKDGAVGRVGEAEEGEESSTCRPSLCLSLLLRSRRPLARCTKQAVISRGGVCGPDVTKVRGQPM